MKYLFLLSTLILFANCNAQKTYISSKHKECDSSVLALNFIKEYSLLDYNQSSDWIIKHPQVSDCVKGIYLEIMNRDFVDADPILAAQDTPSAPYVDSVEDGMVIIKDKYWDNYVCYVTIQDCMITGIGSINTNHIPGYNYGYKSLEPLSAPCIEDLLVEIDKIYTNINANLDSYERTSIQGNGDDNTSTEGGKLDFYFDNNSLVKVEKVFYGEMGNRKIEYYFQKGQLRFYIDQYAEYNAPIYMTEKSEDGMQPYDAEKTVVIIDRHYFDKNGKMFRWVNGDNEEISVSSDEFNNKEEEILRSLNYFQ